MPRENAHLREQLDARTDELRVHRRLLAAALERIPPQLEAPQETPSDAPGGPQRGDAGQGRGQPRSDAPGAQEGAQRRPFWSRLFGG